jgi:hypothetical protein
MKGTRWIEQVGQDLGYALRTFRRSPTLILVAVLSLALGIGANSAIFSLIYTLLLRELPVRDPGRLVALGDPTMVSSMSQGSVRSDIFSVPMYEQFRDQIRVFSGLYASGRTGRLSVGVDPAAEPETARGRLVSGHYFSVLGVEALHGRTFTARKTVVPAPRLSPSSVMPTGKSASPSTPGPSAGKSRSTAIRSRSSA